VSGGLSVTKQIHFATRGRGRREIRSEPAPVPERVPQGTVSRVSRLMALAIRFDELLREGAVEDQADLARLGHISRARVTQIMNLLLLAPDIQEAILDLPLTLRGRDPITETMLRPIAAEVDWGDQRRRWADLLHLGQSAGPEPRPRGAVNIRPTDSRRPSGRTLAGTNQHGGSRKDAARGR
jgi:hypothetical protein